MTGGISRNYFCPKSYQPDDDTIEWAASNLKINRKEVERQLVLMRDHEFRRPYSDWNRVFRNWMRKADELQQLTRERAAPRQMVLSPDERADDQRKFEEQMKKWGIKT